LTNIQGYVQGYLFESSSEQYLHSTAKVNRDASVIKNLLKSTNPGFPFFSFSNSSIRKGGKKKKKKKVDFYLNYDCGVVSDDVFESMMNEITKAVIGSGKNGTELV